MKQIYLLLLVFSISFSIKAQTPSVQWQKCLGGTSYDAAGGVKQTSDGGFIVAGGTSSTNGDVTGNHGGADVWVVKLSATGIIQWKKCYGGTDDDGASSIDLTSDGGYVVAGVTSSNDGDVSGNHLTGSDDIWVLKLDSVGNIQWQKCVGSGISSQQCFSIQQTNDDGYIVAGSTGPGNGGDVSGFHGNNQTDGWVVKLSSTGNLQWQKCLGGSRYEQVRSAQQANDGGYIIAGYTDSPNDGDVAGKYDTIHPNEDAWIVKLDTAGNIQWQKCLGGSKSDKANAVRVTNDGGYIVASVTSSHDIDVTGKHDTLTISQDVWIAKLDANGTIVWQKALGGTGDEAPSDIQQTTDGGYVISADAYSNDGDVSGVHGTCCIAPDLWIVKVNTIGNIQWQKCLGGSLTDGSRSIQQTTNGGYIVSGITGSSNGNVSGFHGPIGYSDGWVVKLGGVTGIEETTVVASNIVLYPNPATNQLFIETDRMTVTEINIYNTTGALVSQTKQPQTKSIDISNLPNGVYIAEIKTKDASVNRRWVKM